MILVFILVLAFLLGYRKKFPNSDRLKMILAVTGFSILVSFLVSFLTVYGVWAVDSRIFKPEYSPLGKLSEPFYLKQYEVVYAMGDIGNVWFEIYCGIETHYTRLWTEGYTMKVIGEGVYQILYPEYPHVDYTVPALLEVILNFTALNIVGIPLAVLIYNMRRILEKVSFGIARFQERYRDNSVYQWLSSE